MDWSENTDPGVRRVEAVDLERLAASSDSIEGIEIGEMSIGDRLIVTTLNSVYTMNCLGDGRFAISGGWFDRRGLSPAVIQMRGCSYGGSAINRRLVAARGLRMEFDNGVVTTPIQRYVLWRHEDRDGLN